MTITTLTLGQLATNCYLLYDDITRDCFIIDPADEGDFISEKILELQLTPQAILLTHGHFDHLLGLLELKLNFSVPIYLHPDDNFLLKQAPSSARHWLGIETGPIPPADQPLTTHTQLLLHTTAIQVIETPGHTPGSICLLGPDFLITGDTVFAEGVGRTDFSYSDSKQLKRSLAQLQQLEVAPQTPFFPGHGQPSRFGDLKKATLL